LTSTLPLPQAKGAVELDALMPSILDKLLTLDIRKHRKEVVKDCLYIFIFCLASFANILIALFAYNAIVLTVIHFFLRIMA
jgi:hypothetical protein